MIQAEKGHNSPKLEEKMFVLKWYLDNNTQDCSHAYATSLDFRLYKLGQHQSQRKPFWIKLWNPNLFAS